MYDINILIKDFEIEKYFKKNVDKILKNEKIKKDQISIVIIDDVLMKKLNSKHRNKKTTTDVLSFVEKDIKITFPQKDNYLGEIFISYNQAKKQAKDIKKEMLDLFVHGYLHLKGYVHDSEEQLVVMNRASNRIIKKLCL